MITVKAPNENNLAALVRLFCVKFRHNLGISGIFCLFKF